MNWKNELTETLNIRFPIVQAPMLGVTTAEMVAAISNLGGLGSLPVGGLSPEKTLELILATKKLTSKPFAVNLFANDVPEINNEEITAMVSFLKTFCLRNNISASIPSPESLRFYSYTEQIEIILQEKIPIVSFTFGILNNEVIKALKDQGTILIGTATSLKEASLLDSNSIDIITAQGIEAGGHRGSFLAGEPLPLIGSMSLIPQIADNINRPVIAAGGISNGKSIKAAMTLGAKGVQVGTAFISSNESIAIPSYKQAIREANETDSVLTNAFTGRWARGIKNKFIEAFEHAAIKIPAYPIQSSLISSIKLTSQQQDNKEFISLWAGQSSSKAETKPVSEIFQQLIESREELELSKA